MKNSRRQRLAGWVLKGHAIIVANLAISPETVVRREKGKGFQMGVRVLVEKGLRAVVQGAVSGTRTAVVGRVLVRGVVVKVFRGPVTSVGNGAIRRLSAVWASG